MSQRKAGVKSRQQKMYARMDDLCARMKKNPEICDYSYYRLKTDYEMNFKAVKAAKLMCSEGLSAADAYEKVSPAKADKKKTGPAPSTASFDKGIDQGMHRPGGINPLAMRWA